MTETQLKCAILKMIKKEFPQVTVFKIADKFTAGIPDLLLCVPTPWYDKFLKPSQGLFYAFEIKTPKGKLSKIQEYTLDKIVKSGGIACVVRSIDEVRQILDNIK